MKTGKVLFSSLGDMAFSLVSSTLSQDLYHLSRPLGTLSTSNPLTPMDRSKALVNGSPVTICHSRYRWIAEASTTMWTHTFSPSPRCQCLEPVEEPTAAGNV